MKNWWDSLNVATKLNIPIQVMLVILLISANLWEMENIKRDILEGAEKRAEISADGIINGLTMFMLTGMISNPDNRRLFIAKMSASERVKELRIIRAKPVQDQFGIGLPEEQIQDDIDRLAIASKKSQFITYENRNNPTLRVVVPFIASTNFRGTNCLTCHHVEVGSVNGAASITLDMTHEFETIERRKEILWLGQLLLQILLFFATRWLIRRFMSPIVKLQSSMESMQAKGSMEKFVPIELKRGHLDEIGKLTSAFNLMSAALSDSEKSMRLAESIYQTNSDAILVTDEENLIVNVNPAFTRITGYTFAEAIGNDPKLLKSGKHDKIFYQQMWHSILTQGTWEGEIWDKRKNGVIYPKLAHIHVLRRADGSVYRHIAQFSDITEKKQKDELIFWQANYDALTSLPNRRLLIERLERALIRIKRKNNFGALLFLDMDKFKSLNDTLGHEYGDMLLIEVSRRLKACVRDGDTVARLGGDEFVVLVESISDFSEDASFIIAEVAEKIRSTLARPYQLGKYEYLSSPSIGVYLYDAENDSVKELIKRADMAMYQAKGSGRNTVRFFDPQMQELVDKHSALEADLHRAIPNNQFELYYQIQLDMDLRPIGAEALIRWNHPSNGLIPPGQFIPFAEGTPLILEIGNWVLDTACRQISLWSKQTDTRKLVLAVNISAQQFKHPSFVDEVNNMIKKHGIDPSCLKLELTESVAVQDIDSVVTKMDALRKSIGVTLSLDDFGTGYSSLSYLKRLPLDQIKIDQSFVRDMTIDPADEVMVKTIIDMAHNFGLNVIAEGVETEAHLNFLKKNGCKAFQGYLFGKPVPVLEFESLLKKYSRTLSRN
jgi:diguanylate cyclase (GGDEF)-like protein/PAS domain S-box-containing protein